MILQLGLSPCSSNPDANSPGTHVPSGFQVFYLRCQLEHSSHVKPLSQPQAALGSHHLEATSAIALIILCCHTCVHVCLSTMVGYFSSSVPRRIDWLNYCLVCHILYHTCPPPARIILCIFHVLWYSPAGSEENTDFVPAVMYNFPLIITYETGTLIIHTYWGETEF